MSDAFVFPCTKLPKRPFWKSRPNYSLEYAGGAFKQRVALDFESIPDYPRDRDQWMSSQIQFQLPNTVETVSPFSMSSALPLLKANSSADVKSVTSSERANTGSNPVNLSYTSPDASDFLLGGRGYAAVNHDPFGLPAIPELSWSARLSAAEADNGHSNAGSHVHLPDTNEEDDSFTHSNPVPVLIPGGPGSNSSTHSGLTSDSAPRTPPMEAQKDYFVAAHTQPEGYSHEAYPAAPHSYLSSPSTLYLRDSWGQFVLDAQSHYVSTAGSTHNTNTELRSNRPPSTIEERGEKWAGEVPNVWSLFSATPTSGAMKLPPTPPIPIQPQSQPVAPSPVPRPLTQTQTTLMINPIFAHILWDIRYPPASASLITSKSKARTLTDPDSWTRGLSEVEVVAPATYPPKSTLLISSPHTRWRARVESEGGEGEYVSVADVLHALHDQLVLRFVKQAEWDKLDDRTKWYVGRAYGRNRLDDPSDADAASMNSGFSGAAGSVWSEGSRMSGESIVCGPGTAWGEGVRRADVLRDRTMFGGLRVDPAYKRKRRMQGSEADADESLLVMELKRVERPTSMTSV